MASINTNIAAYYAQNNLHKSADAAQASIARLSSGNKIVRASDDVAGLSIGTILRTNVSTLKTASTNASQGSTLLQVADGAISSLGEILQRQKALAVQANSGTLGTKERGYLDQEFQSLKSEYDRIVKTTNFNGVSLLDGSIASSGALASSGPAATTNYNATTSSTALTTLTSGLNGTGFVAAGFSTGTSTSNSFVGSLANATVSASYAGTSSVGIAITVNGVTYQSDAAVDTSGAAATTNFTATDGSGQTFRLDLNTLDDSANGGVAIADQTHANNVATKLQADLRTITIYQGRSIGTSAISSASLANTALAGLDGSKFTVTGTEFGKVAGSTTAATQPSIGSFSVTSNSSTDASFSIVINGHTYKNDHVTVDNAVKNNDLGGGTGKLKLTSVDDPNSTFQIDIGSLTGDINLATPSAAKTFEDAVNKAIGSSSFGGLNFQVGTSSSDSIGISQSSLSTTNVFKDSTGVAQSLDITTTANAKTASDVLDNAINTLTAARSNVGALQERFNYASDTLSVSIQNLDAARGSFLDTDISEESTKYATEQVQQQAAISVLAQANQLPQNLLKLIGQ